MRKFIFSLAALGTIFFSYSEANACPSEVRVSRIRTRPAVRRERVVVEKQVIRQPVRRERIVVEEYHQPAAIRREVIVEDDCQDCRQSFRQPIRENYERSEIRESRSSGY